MYIIGCILHENAVPDIWYFEHALTLMVFLFVGQLFKTYPVNRYNPIAAVVYVLAIVALQCAGLPHPFITANIHVVLSNSWLYLPLAVTGTLLILWLSERIGKNGLLEYFGKSSLVVYTLHISVLAACQNTAARWWGEAATTGVWFSVAQLVLTLLLLLGLIGLLNLKYLRFLTGRFN